MTRDEQPFDGRFWISHVLWPAFGFVFALSLIGILDLDRRISHAFYYDAVSNHWLGNEGGLWARDFIHTGGRWLVRSLATVAIIVWIATFCSRRLASWRRAAGYAVIALALSAGIVGGLKAVSNVDCPWDLAEFGGDRPYVGLFSERPESLPHAACFPGAHAASGFALVCGYFLFRDRSKRKAAMALGLAVLVGVAFSFGQEARGAHFLSHDLTSAAIVWFVQLLLYALILAPRYAEIPQMRVVRI